MSPEKIFVLFPLHSPPILMTWFLVVDSLQVQPEAETVLLAAHEQKSIWFQLQRVTILQACNPVLLYYQKGSACSKALNYRILSITNYKIVKGCRLIDWSFHPLMCFGKICFSLSCLTITLSLIWVKLTLTANKCNVRRSDNTVQLLKYFYCVEKYMNTTQ